MSHPQEAHDSVAPPVLEPGIKNLRHDLVSGFLVFLIALPLCLAISIASGYPPISGVFTAIIGGIVGGLISNSQLTIKGPAAGLIVIAVGCVTEFNTEVFGGNASTLQDAYRMALGVGVVAAAVQIVFALVRAGILAEMFPTAAVHGMLAAIGFIIISKQIPVALGLKVQGEPLELIKEIPNFIREMNPEIAFIGALSLLILFIKPLFKQKWVKMIPSQMLVLFVAVPIGMYLGLSHDHTYTLANHEFHVGNEHLVNVNSDFNLLKAIALPDFSGLKYGFAWKWVAMYALIGSLESLLSAKAVDLLDPYKRKSNLNRDLLAVAIGNLAASMIGGLPMISEIVRSRANIDNGGRTRFANVFHGLFLLLCVCLIPGLIHQIPLAALAAMLIYTGCRLAHYKEFAHMLHVGPEQLVVFVTTIVATLATDLLIGIGIGIGVKLIIHLFHGAAPVSLVKPKLEVRDDESTRSIVAGDSATFTNWLIYRGQLQAALKADRDVVLDLSTTRLVDHTVMEKLHEVEREFASCGRTLTLSGLENHVAMSSHPTAARQKSRPK